jgi:tRNA G18 (ribose-2'-O)-methylase SpoU
MDALATVPMAPGVDSFSVNAAAAVILYEIRRAGA